jgi:hypothetical protein
MVMDYVIYDGETGLPLITVKGVSLIDLWMIMNNIQLLK